MDTESNMKTCVECKKHKSLTMFPKNKLSGLDRFSYRSKCKKCCSQASMRYKKTGSTVVRHPLTATDGPIIINVPPSKGNTGSGYDISHPNILTGERDD